MICINKDCEYRTWNIGGEVGDFYYCGFVGVEEGRGLKECLVSKFDREIAEEEIQ